VKIAEAAAIAGVNSETIRRRVRRGELAAWGSPRRVALGDVLRQYIPSGMQEVVEGGINLDTGRK
jgi:hypothetical protein